MWYLTHNQKPFFVLGGQVNNSSAYTRERLEPLWDALVQLHANTAEVPEYWEQLEPAEGTFDFSMVDAVLLGARAHGLKLILLWFATWKNGTMKYAPAWVKRQPSRFTRVITPEGLPLPVLSPHCAATQAADQRAFCALLEYVRERDGGEHTVIAVQVENEPGIHGAERDCSAEANALFSEAVPTELMSALPRMTRPGVQALWEAEGARTTGTWAEIFGYRAPEIFSAWHCARYIDVIAAAGKHTYDLPLYVNVWLSEGGFRRAGYDYPSGGAVSDMIEIWKVAAPHVDLLAPDIYFEDTATFRELCAIYQRADNPLLIPESRIGPALARQLFYAIAAHQAIGIAVFGIDDHVDATGKLTASAHAVADSFAAVQALLPLILAYQGTDRIQAIVEEEGAGTQYLALDGYAALVRFGEFWHGLPVPARSGADAGRARGVLVQTGPKEFYVAGVGFSVYLRPLDGRMHRFLAKSVWAGQLDPWLTVEEGHFEEETWVVDARRSGDESDYGLTMAVPGRAVHAVLD